MSQAAQTYCVFPESDAVVDIALEPSPQGPEYFALDDVDALALQDGNLTRSDDGPVAVVLETIRSAQGTTLLMAANPELPVTVNGLSAPRVGVLKTGDVVGIEQHLLHVSLLNRPYSGPPEEQQLGVQCSYCRLPITDDANLRIYVCPACQQPIHDHDEEVSQEQRLECAKLSSRCGNCDAEIIKSEELSHVPEL